MSILTIDKNMKISLSLLRKIIKEEVESAHASESETALPSAPRMLSAEGALAILKRNYRFAYEKRPQLRSEGELLAAEWPALLKKITKIIKGRGSRDNQVADIRVALDVLPQHAELAGLMLDVADDIWMAMSPKAQRYRDVDQWRKKW